MPAMGYSIPPVPSKGRDGGFHRVLARALAGVALAAVVAARAGPIAGGPPCDPAACAGYDWQVLGDGLYAAIRREPPGLLEHANSLVIVNDTDVVVVDSQMTPSATRELIRAISKVTTRPVRYVINTHWHDDHMFGNAAYAAAYPGVEFISSPDTRDDFETLGRDNRQQFLAALPGEMELLRRHLASGTALNWRDLGSEGPPLDDAARRSLASSIEQAARYLAEAPGTTLVSPSVTVETQLVLMRGSREIRILCVGPGHTRGDVVVWLPKEGVLASGDVVSAIVPMAGGTTDLAVWARALDRLIALGPRTIVPGHGPAQPGDALLHRTKALLESVLERTAAAYRPGATLAEVRSNVQLDDLRRAWASTDPMRQLLFAMFFEEPAIASVYRRLSAALANCRDASDAGAPCG
jgi:cyclase